jgi:2-polyprenyl-3-methyl-5-hydroxy-6-metoxy-1,4-benzoquinol methylase
MAQPTTPVSPPETLERTQALGRNSDKNSRDHGLPQKSSGRKGEIARHVSVVLERMIAGPMAGAAERDRDYVRRWILDLKELTQYIEVILNRRQQYQGNDFRALDVGTSLGILPLTLKSMGVNASACDHPRQGGYGPWIEKEGVPYAPFDLMDGDLPYASESFDVITFKQVIEHLPFSAKPALRSFHRVLRPGGLLLLSTPNIARLSSVLRLFLRRSVHPPLEEFFNADYPFTGHYREYTLDELKRMVVWSGFEVARTQYVQHNSIPFLIGQKKRFANNLFMPITWKEILVLSAWQAFTFMVPSLSQEVFVVAMKPGA